MEQKLAELTKKIYQEGVEKGEQEKQSIVDAANKEAADIKAAAEKEAASIIAKAEEKAADLKRNTESELKLSSKQALNTLKQQITDLVSSKSLDKDISDAMSIKDILEKCIVEIASNWNDKSASLEVLLSEKNRAELQKSVESKVKKVLDGTITIEASKGITSGFKIGPEGGAYKLSLTDEDFAVFFKEYLRPATRKLLFDE